MSPLRLILHEIAFRRWNFLLVVLAIVAAASTLMGTVASLRAYDLQTEQTVAKMEARSRQEMAALEDSIRRSMKGLGFNIYIFPEGQDLSEVYSQGYASSTMPEAYVHKLAESDLVTVNHLLPSLTRKLKWPERERTVVLIGIRGEVPQGHRPIKAPLLDPVESGSVVLGYELHRSLEIRVGDRIAFMGRSFVVSRCHAERGTVDDITIWMNLVECQALLELPGQINAIQALECNCATVDRLGEVRGELLKILPGTTIIERGSSALARAEARNQARETAAAEIAARRAERASLKQGRESLASVLLPLVTVSSMAIIGLLAFLNVRERIGEVGILRAIGVRTGRLLGVLLGRAFCAGIVGATIGILVSAALWQVIAPDAFEDRSLLGLFSAGEIVLVAVGAPVLSCLAGWLPSLAAAQRDPAEVLRHE